MLSNKNFIDNKYLVDNFYSFIALNNLDISITKFVLVFVTL